MCLFVRSMGSNEMREGENVMENEIKTESKPVDLSQTNDKLADKKSTRTRNHIKTAEAITINTR